ncbi:MAG: AAA family ATPase [Sulfuricurvum sp.]
MTYWHMQLHPNDQGWGREKELLSLKPSVIGLGDWKAGKSQILSFNHEMQIDDIVLIKHGAQPIALVKVIGEVIDTNKVIKRVENDFNPLAWFCYRREVKVLGYAPENSHDFPSPRGALKKAKNPSTPTYQYIAKWHQKVSPDFFYNHEGMKIKKLYIQKHKVFEEFTINLEDTNSLPLPIVVIAGINGSGKTTLLEYMKNFAQIIEKQDTNKSTVEFTMNNTSMKLNYLNATELKMIGAAQVKRDTSEKKSYEENIGYFSTSENLTNLKEFITEYLEQKVWAEQMNVADAYHELQEKINSIFEELDLAITFDQIKKEDKETIIFFKNEKGERFSIDDISTGEKTLLSKVLYLYLKEINNKVILIDEPELSLHPAWQNRVLKLYENFAIKNNCQIIIATHSPHIIGSAKNESIRVLQKNREGKMEALDHFSQSYGLEFHKILTEIMGVEYLRTPEVAEKLATLKKMIAQNHFDTSEFQEKWQELEEIFGENYLDLKLLKLEIASRRKSVQNH